MTVPLHWEHPQRPADSEEWRALVLPGGGYGHLAIAKEGVPAARWLADRGITTAVASYRVAPHRHPAPLADGRWALDQVQRSAPSARVLVWGFSAGAHLAGLLAADPSTRPELLVLSYPVVSLRRPDGHAGSADRLLGADASDEQRNALSLDRLLGPGTPPVMLIHGSADRVVPPERSRSVHDHLESAGVASRLHVVPGAPHGFGLAAGAPPDDWLGDLDGWLSEHREDPA